jgi:hypothetical protein
MTRSRRLALASYPCDLLESRPSRSVRIEEHCGKGSNGTLQGETDIAFGNWYSRRRNCLSSPAQNGARGEPRGQRVKRGPLSRQNRANRPPFYPAGERPAGISLRGAQSRVSRDGTQFFHALRLLRYARNDISTEDVFSQVSECLHQRASACSCWTNCQRE